MVARRRILCVCMCVCVCVCICVCSSVRVTNSLKHTAKSDDQMIDETYRTPTAGTLQRKMNGCKEKNSLCMYVCVCLCVHMCVCSSVHVTNSPKHAVKSDDLMIDETYRTPTAGKLQKKIDCCKAKVLVCWSE